MQKLFAYSFFAFIATLANIFLQDISLRLYTGPHHIILSILIGTCTGLLVKYWLDKRYIFLFKANDMAHDLRTFALYAGMGVFTTVIFWFFEISFHIIFGTKEMRYAGAAFGLTIGYIVKYQMDKRFVFKTPQK